MNFLFIPEGMTKERLEEHFKMFYRKHFMWTETLAGYTSMIWHSLESWRRLFLNLSGFFRFIRSSKRLGT